MLVLNACVAVLRGWAAKIRETYPRLKPISFKAQATQVAGHEASRWLPMRHQVVCEAPYLRKPCSRAALFPSCVCLLIKLLILLYKV